MSAGKQPQSPECSAAQHEQNKESLLECPVCRGDLRELPLAMFDCGHVVCQLCEKTMKKNAAKIDEYFHRCPICRVDWIVDVAPHFSVSLIQVIVRQDANMAAVRAEAADAAATAAAVLAAVLAKHALDQDKIEKSM